MIPTLVAATPGPQFVIVAAVVIGCLVPFTYRSWHKETHDLMQKLAEQGTESPRDHDDECITAAALKRRMENLPKVVQQYLESTLSLTLHNTTHETDDDEKIIPFARALRVEQEGKFLLNEQWIPFTATQEFSARRTHPGFVWDAVMKKPCFPLPGSLTIPILVRDAYIPGIGGIMKAQLPLGITLVNMKDTPDLNLGEVMRWIAESTLFPMVLVPQVHECDEAPVLKWSPGADTNANSARLEFKHKGYLAQVDFYFDPHTHMVTTIHAKRPRTVGSKTEMTHWEGHFSDYEIHGGLLVPSKMEVGWKFSDDSPLELYFRGKNVKFIYLMNAGSRQEHSSREIHPHME
ncbi:hypothetical protein HJC23_010564 [Cyclotella cryptica]|uniref:Uncharacterized protein n=1 Tax=Cyclotella cryptica TaxID=29204 RepID=A0ABD3NWA3_9STRA|eukprot:CCRYP_019507-RA/>CCRYP_019507-RA protein AED:0.08 eAED:0.08 QI:0/-1/0/1/-1/1/1/0/347